MVKSLNRMDKKILRFSIELGKPFTNADIFKCYLFDFEQKEIDVTLIEHRLQSLYESGYLTQEQREDGNYYTLKAAAAAKLRKHNIL